MPRRVQLAWRLQRGALLGWTAGFAIAGAAFGSIAQDVGDVIGDSADILDALRAPRRTDSLADAYLAATFGILALIAAGYAMQATLRLRGEETSGRAEPLLATALSRTRWALSHAGIALGGTAVLMATAGLTAGIAHAAQTGRRRRDAAAARRRAGAGPGRVGAGRRRARALRPRARRPRPPGPRSRSASRWPSSARCSSSRRSVIDLSPFAHSPAAPGRN